MGFGTMLPRWLPRLGPYGLALLLAVAGGLVRWALVALVGPGLYTFITFYPFVMLAALVGGWGPGVLATLTAALWANYWLMSPYGQFGLERSVDAVNLVIFCSIGAFMSVVAGLFQRMRGHLKELVQERTRQLETADGQLQAQAGELRTANEELRQSEYLRRLAEEITRVGAFEWNIITGVNTWTPELEALHGLPPGGFAGTYTAWEQLVHPEDRARAAATVQRAFETSETVEDEWRVTWPDGSIHWLAGRFRILRDEAGQPRTLTGVNIDITERKQAEAELVRYREHLEELVQERAGQLATANARLQEQGKELTAQAEALRRSEQRLSLAQQIAHVGTFDLDLRTGVNVWTPELEAMYGLPPGGFSKTRLAWEQLVHPEDRAEASRLVEQSLDTGGPTEGQWRVVWADGGVRWLAGRWQVFKDEAGKPYRMTGVNIDITERKQAEERLRESEEKYRRIVETATEGIVMADAEARMVFVNDRWSEIFGYSPEEARQVTLFDLVFPEDRDQMAERWESRKRGRKEGYEFRFRRKDGRPVWLLVGVAPRLDSEGRFLGTLGMVTDVTERKQAEEAVRVISAELQRTLDTAAAGLTRCSRDLRYIWANPAYAQVAGLPLEQIVGRPMVDVMGQAAFEVIRPYVEQVLRGERVQYEAQVPFAAAGDKFLHVVYTPDQDADGNVAGWVASVTDITERKKAEETVRQSERRFRSTFENAAIGIAHVSLDGQILKFNSRFCEIAGYLPDDIIGKTCEEITFVDDWKAEKTQMQQLLDGQVDHYSIEKRYVRRDGGFVWVNLTRSIQHDGAGQPEYFIVLVEDITDRKRAEEALREAREELEVRVQERTAELREAVDLVQAERQRFQNVLDQLPAYLVLLTPDHRMAFANRFFEQRFGKCEGRRCYEHLFQRPEPCANCEAYKVLETNEPRHWEWTGPDGHDYDIYDFPFTDADGSPLIMEVGLDITERKRADEALRQSQETFAELIERAPFGIYVVDSQFRIAHMNASSQNGAFRNVRPVTGRAFTEAMRILWPEEVAAQIIAVFRHTLQTGVPYYSPRFVNPRADVDITEAYEWELHRMTLPDGQYGVICYYYDSTKLQQSNEELKKRTAELLHRTRQLQKLTLELSETEDRERKRMAEILHDDLQQQIAGAKFHLGVLRSRVKYDSSLQTIGAQVDHMLKDAIDKSRSLSHELSPTVLHHGDFAETLRWLANEVQAKHGLLVHVRAPGVVRLQSDALKSFLYRAAQELLFNIVKHAGVKEAEIRVRQCFEHICLAVSDRGRGFDPQELREATGFGLLSIRERVSLLGGRMKIKSAKGKGSVFLIVVPNGEIVAPGDKTTARPNGRTEAAEQAAEEENGRLRVLLADDHEIVREGLRSLLSDEHDVVVVGEAANGREAVDLASQLRPDVIVMDMSMPLIEGDEATRQIKTYLPETRVIAISMYDQTEKIDAMYRAGAESYVLKTAPSEELLAAIRGKEGSP